MAISQPTYPITTSALVTHVGTYADTKVDTADARVTADQIAATASIRTLGTGAAQAAAGNHTHTGLTEQAAATPSVRAIGATGTTVVAGNDTRLTAGAAGTATVRALGTTSTTAAAGNDSRLSDTRTPTDATVSLAKLATDSLAHLKAVVVEATGSYGSRPTGFASVEFIGADDPGVLAQNGDTWVPTA